MRCSGIAEPFVNQHPVSGWKSNALTRIDFADAAMAQLLQDYSKLPAAILEKAGSSS